MMRLILILMLSFPLLAVAQGKKVECLTLHEVEQRMAKEPRKILVDVYTSWCGPCRVMDQNTFQNPAAVEYINRHYYAVKLIAESPETIELKGNTDTKE